MQELDREQIQFLKRILMELTATRGAIIARITDGLREYCMGCKNWSRCWNDDFRLYETPTQECINKQIEEG